jgi:iron(III) transport system substrate-binding protein
MPRRLAPALLALLLVAAGALTAACGGSDKGDAKLVVYSGREQELVEPLYARFTEDTGIELDVRYGDSPALSATILEEGAASPADVFYAQDAASIGILDGLLAELPEADRALIPARFQDPGGRWIGVTGRVRVLTYNTERVDPAQLPASVLDLARPDWALGDIGIAPANASFVGFVGAMREALGDEATQAWLDGIAEHARSYEKNSQIVDAIATGEVDTGLVNHYYLYEKLASDPQAPVANHGFSPADVGSFANVSAVGILASAGQPEEARTFVNWLLTEGQVFFANEAEEREYPLNEAQPGLEGAADLPPLSEAGGPDVDLAALSEDLETTVQMIRGAGLVS